ncbi:MAG: exodeoxyribonuclease VII small subunit [Clostridia bacterium]|nr:exodeoxyribonuclease VII small subunit [Clostridia bacterium]
MNNDKFKNMDYETALKKLSSLISDLESGQLSFDDTLVAYKEAFEYYTFLSDYLKTAGEKIKEMNQKMSQISPYPEG